MPIPKWFYGEVIGTFILVFFGIGSVAAAVSTGALVGVFQVAIVWGLGIATAIYLTGSLSGAHLNPAVTIAMAVWNDFPFKRIFPYIVAQLLGAFIAAAMIFLIFNDPLAVYEKDNGIIRGEEGSEATAMVFGEFFPNPGGKPLDSKARKVMSHPAAFAAEVIATAMLLVVIFGVTDERNKSKPQILTALTIGLTVTMLISLIGPLTMACMNPARDLAPRIFSSLAGWGEIPFTASGGGGAGWITVYLIAPIIGGIIGGGIYRLFLKDHYASEDA